MKRVSQDIVEDAEGVRDKRQKIQHPAIFAVPVGTRGLVRSNATEIQNPGFIRNGTPIDEIHSLSPMVVRCGDNWLRESNADRTVFGKFSHNPEVHPDSLKCLDGSHFWAFSGTKRLHAVWQQMDIGSILVFIERHQAGELWVDDPDEPSYLHRDKKFDHTRIQLAGVVTDKFILPVSEAKTIYSPHISKFTTMEERNDHCLFVTFLPYRVSYRGAGLSKKRYQKWTCRLKDQKEGRKRDDVIMCATKETLSERTRKKIMDCVDPKGVSWAYFLSN